MRAWKWAHTWVLALALGLSACDRGPDPSAADESAGERGPEKRGAAAPKGAGDGAQKDVLVEQVSLLGAKIKGPDTALVTIVEMSDYACPFCKKAHATVESLLGEYQGRVRLAVFENPLPFHRTAKPAAKWAFAAGEQGKFWQARDVLFENQKNLDDEGLLALAQDMGLDMDRLEADRNSQSAARYVERGIELSRSLGAKGTPTFFVNGVRLIGAQPAGAFRAAFEEALGRADAMVARGVKPENVYSEILKAAVPYKAGASEPAADGRNCGQGCGDDGAGDPAKSALDAKVEEVEIGDAPVRGAANAKVTVVVFTDFECPFCAKSEATLRAVEKEYSGKVRIAYKSFPLPFHESARLAARASLAAHRQGKFFEYRDALFAHQEELDRSSLIRYAGEVGLDVDRFQRDLDDKATELAVQADEAQVKRLGIAGTPTFFVNGRRIAGAQPVAAFRAQIDAALDGL
ncbi:MAG: thioredoxin domain-containing protein [Polyangiaceae bacterium]